MNRASELILLLILLVLIGFARVYYGGEEGLMVVWKGEFSYKDTLVNLPCILAMAPDERAREHPSVDSQLEGMSIYGAYDRGGDRWRKYRSHDHGVRLQQPKSTPTGDASPPRRHSSSLYGADRRFYR